MSQSKTNIKVSDSGARLRIDEGFTEIFICYTPFQIFIASSIIRTQLESNHDTRPIYILVDGNKCLQLQNHGNVIQWDHIITPPQKMGSTYSGFRDNMRQIVNSKIVLSAMEPLISNQRKIGIYYPHLYEYLTNYFYFSYKHTNIEYKVIQDGILNYYGVRTSRKKYLNQCFKALLGRFWKLPFIPVKGYMTGIDREDVTIQYVLGAENLADNPRKSICVEVAKSASDIDYMSVLLIGQENLIPTIGEEKYVAYLQKATQLIRKRFTKKQLYYKPRNHDLFKKIMEYCDLQDFDILNESITIEELYLKRSFGHLVGFHSSALLNIKLLYGKQIHCYSYAFSNVALETMNPLQKQTLENVFFSLGIEFI